jgi:hypothetical protein
MSRVRVSFDWSCLGLSRRSLPPVTGRSHRAQGRDDGGPHAGYSPSRAATLPAPTSNRHKPAAARCCQGLIGRWRSAPGGQHRRADLLGRCALGDKGARSGLAGDDHPGALSGGEHRYLDLGQVAADAGGGLDPVKPGHAPQPAAGPMLPNSATIPGTVRTSCGNDHLLKPSRASTSSKGWGCSQRRGERSFRWSAQGLTLVGLILVVAVDGIGWSPYDESVGLLGLIGTPGSSSCLAC